MRASDSAFWNQHGAVPRAYVSLETGRRLWRNRFGDLTAIRIKPPAGDDPVGQVEKALQVQLDPEAGGFVFDRVKENALDASRGGTDFGMLFLGFSFFLIAAALLLVGLLFRLSLDRRASEVGVLVASGFRRGRIRRLLLAEGCLIAAIGGLVGMVAAIGYGEVLLGRLRAWWPGGSVRSFSAGPPDPDEPSAGETTLAGGNGAAAEQITACTHTFSGEADDPRASRGDPGRHGLAAHRGGPARREDSSDRLSQQ